MAEEATTATTETSGTAPTAAAEPVVGTPVTPPAGTTTQTPETKAETRTEQDAKPVIPEKYEFTAPEGMAIDSAALESFTPLAKSMGLTQENAQKLADWYAGQTKAGQEAHAKQQETWFQEVANDKEVGGANFEANMKAANDALIKLATPEEIKALQTMGLANYPPLAKLLLRAHGLMKEDTFVSGATAAAKEGNMFLPGSTRT